FANEGDRPYLTTVGPEVIATYVRIATEVSKELTVPFGCGVLIDPKATIAVANAIGAKFVRTYVSNSYEGSFGSQSFNPGEIFRYQKAIGAEKVRVYTYFEPHGATCVDTRPVSEQIDSGFAVMPIAGMLVGGPRAGLPPEQAHFRKIKEQFPDRPLILGSGANKDNIQDLLPYADGVIVGTTIKEGKYLYNPIDYDRAKEFIEAARKAQK
ncbi:MAG: BtpA/SgcQ family protein, partial [Erysipelotrichaceae bacterium]